MTKKTSPIAAAHRFTAGDTVRALANNKRVPEGSVGRVVMLSASSGNPIVDFPHKGRALMAAHELAPAEPHDVPLPKSNQERVPLGDEQPPYAVVPVSEPPPPSWSEAAEPVFLRPSRPVVRMPEPAWTPPESRIPPLERELVTTDAPPVKRPPGHPKGKKWSPEQRARHAETIARRRSQAREEERNTVHETPERVPANPTPEPETAPVPSIVAVASPRAPLTPRPSRAYVLNGQASTLDGIRLTLAVGLDRGLSSRSVLELAQLLCQIEEET